MPSETIKFTLENDDGEEVEHELPAVYGVCPTCRGRGSHVDPAIDGNGITASEWEEWDPEEREDYMNGVYDVPCSECKGLRVVLVVDEDHLSAEQAEILKRYNEYLQEVADYNACCAAERKMGA